MLKNRPILKLLLLSITLILCACASGHRKPFTDNLSPARNLSLYEHRLKKAVTSSRHLSLNEIGHVNYPGFEAPLWGRQYMRLTGQLSITNHYRLYHSPYVFAVETPTALPFDDRMTMQRTAVDMLVDYYTK